MKKTYKYIATLISFMILSCSSDDKTVDGVIGDPIRGVILRTISFPSATFNFFDNSSSWTVTVEAQGENLDEIIQEVEVYGRLISTNGNSDEALVTTIPASAFVPSPPFGLPRANLSVVLSDVLNAIGLEDGEYLSNDQFNLRLNLKLTDGRAYTSTDVNPNVRAGQFFTSPFNYRAQFFCPVEEFPTLFSGNYVVVEDVWADYAPGEIVPVVVGEDPFTFRILSTNNPFIANTDTSYIEVTINPANGNVTAASNEPFDYGVPVDVTGTGRVGTCTGDIILSLNFGAFASDQSFVLTKQ